MKALFSFLFIAFFTNSSSFAQTPDSLEIGRFTPYTSAGIQAGINISSLNNYNGSDTRIGMLLGLNAEYRFSELFGVATELAYSQQGTTHQNIEYGMNYLKLPLLLTMHDNNFMVQAGGYGAVLLKANALYGTYSENVTKHFKPTETGLCLGMAVQFWGNTALGARFYRGLQNVNKSLTDRRLYLFNNTLQLTAGYSF